ncbi:MAG: NAD(P)H-binding protein, partial [Armatimonadota bacterium]
MQHIPDQQCRNNDLYDMYSQELLTLPQPGLGKILVTGATGYVGGRLVPELLARGYYVRVMVRAFSPELQERWPGAEVVVGDALNADSLTTSLKDIHTAFYLIHSLLGGHKRFEEMDIKAATNFRKASDQNNVRRIIYLGALGDVRSQLSKHLRNRQEVCVELMRGKAAVTALRAAIIIGSGSASFEVMEHLVRRLPMIFLPSWAETECQPIAIRNVVTYLVGALESPEMTGGSYDIGGLDILSYHEMLRVFSEVLSFKRVFIGLPVNSPVIYSYIISLITPVAHSIILSLIESAANTVICQNND